MRILTRGREWEREELANSHALELKPKMRESPANIPTQTRIIDHINKHEGVEWVMFEEMCDHFKSTNTPAEGALMPAAVGAILEKK